MGFTPLEGLVMATRSGSVDPGLLVWLLQDGRLPLGEVAAAWSRSPGWRASPGCRLGRHAGRPAGRREGVSRPAGGRGLPAPAAAGDRRDGRGMNGLDVLVFTGGVGEHSAAGPAVPRPAWSSSA